MSFSGNGKYIRMLPRSRSSLDGSNVYCQRLYALLNRVVLVFYLKGIFAAFILHFVIRISFDKTPEIVKEIKIQEC